MQDTNPPFLDAEVEAAFAAFPDAARDGLLALRRLIFETAAETSGVGHIKETLKWGQPAYLTPTTKSGSTIRLGVPKHGGFAIYTNCQTTIMSDFQAVFADDFTYEGNRAIHFSADKPVPQDKIRMLIAGALTYHLR